MFQTLYEEMTRFAAEGELLAELQRAKGEYAARTGEMFESDIGFERKIAAFLEWYVLDRKLSFLPEQTPAELFVAQKCGAMAEQERARYVGLTQSVLSLFEFKGIRPDFLVVRDLVADKKLFVYERRKTIGLQNGDILEARLVPYDGQMLFSDAYFCHPRDARRALLKAAKQLRKAGGGAPERITLVHRAAYFATRAERYKHVSAKKIYAEIVEPPASPLDLLRSIAS